MVANHYDVIVVGARCAGSPTAMLLARQGYRVLLVDRAAFPSDTISTHVVQPPGIAALNRWGLLSQLLSTGCPPVGTYAFDFGPFTIAGSPGTDDSPVAYAPRRTVLDQLLVDAAASAGAEVRGVDVDADRHEFLPSSLTPVSSDTDIEVTARLANSGCRCVVISVTSMCKSMLLRAFGS
jgi:2-polyprenyl-6-methoxyphenol hydroxylase-like FAD-dependent oxidoreductase